MKINPTAYNVGKTGTVHSPEAEAAARIQAEAAARAENNTDKILISSQGALQAEISHLTKAIVSEIEKPAPPERLSAISQAVRNGTYHVPTADLVNSIMQRWMGL